MVEDDFCDSRSNRFTEPQSNCHVPNKTVNYCQLNKKGFVWVETYTSSSILHHSKLSFGLSLLVFNLMSVHVADHITTELTISLCC